ncbi:MAG TPA: glutathione transferase GstA [Stenotrophobium sp.]|jgi:glutathione S-transferase|nr:glutathione transferase GstA [Stenotrophobium sp.]
MKLYYSPGACSLSPHIVACEAGLQLQLEKVDLAAKKTATGADFLAINPKGYVPALVLDSGELLTEGPAIVQYLADLKPASKLAPAHGTLARYQLQSWLNFISTEIHKQFTPLFKPTTPAEVRQGQVELLGKRFDLVVKALAGQAYLTGDSFTVADAYLFTVVNWTNFVKIDLGPWPELQKFQARVAARPAVQQALQAEGLLKKA